MKMKSKFFGYSAKLVLAILAAGVSLTSCYDSENGDVPQPVKFPDPVYTITGNITDVETGAPLNDATVKVNGQKVTLTDGVYSAKAQAGQNIVTVSMAGYNNDEEVQRTISIEAIKAGQSYTAVVNVALLKNGADFDASDVAVIANTKMESSPCVMNAKDEEYVGLDLVADDESFSVVRKFDVSVGARLYSDSEFTTEANLDELFVGNESLKNYVVSYLGTIIGQFGEVSKVEVPYSIYVPANNSVENVTLTYQLLKGVYTFTYEDQSYSLYIKAVDSYSFSTKYVPNHGMGHGHGHDYDGNLNAGGGIFE